MFFLFAAWHSGNPPPVNLPAIEALYRLHPNVLQSALEFFYSTRTLALPADYPDYREPAVPAPPNVPNLVTGITGNTLARWDHAIYGYMIENTRIFEIFDRVLREFEAGERFETPDKDTALWLRTTEALFYRDLPGGSIGSLTSSIRPDIRATRRNTYYRLLGLDLNHGLDGNRPYQFDKPVASNRDFVNIFEGLLREIWRGAMNASNGIGPNETDNAAIADHARRLREMLLVRRNNGSLLREEFWSVVTMAWFHLALMEDTPIVRALKAEAEGPGDRLRKIGERVSIPAHARADNYFSMAFELSQLLRFIEEDPAATQAGTAHGYYMLPGPGSYPNLPNDMRTIITHWSAATGREIKAQRVALSPSALAPMRDRGSAVSVRTGGP
jgi:hypothetical protein